MLQANENTAYMPNGLYILYTRGFYRANRPRQYNSSG